MFDREIGLDHPPLIVAEISCNHQGDIYRLLDLIATAHESGADAVKIQTYIAAEMTLDAPKKHLMIQDGPWAGRYLYDLYKENQLPLEWLPEIFGFAKNNNINLFSSVFGVASLATLESVDCPVYKIASFEANDPNFIELVRKQGKPLIVSTGLCSEDDINRIYKTIDKENTGLMHCVSAYPTKFMDANLSKIGELRYIYDIEVGFSDHTTEIDKSAIAAVAMGATVLEKHFKGCDTKSDDDFFSLNPYHFKTYAKTARETFESIKYRQVKDEEKNRQFRRSIYAMSTIKKGDKFNHSNIAVIRGPNGVAPHNYKFLLGRTAKHDYEYGDFIQETEL